MVTTAAVVACPVDQPVDYEYMIRCSPDDGRPVAVIVSFDATGVPDVSYHDVNANAKSPGPVSP